MRLVPALLLLCACTAPAPLLVLRVEGMQRGEGGKTWMAWPETVQKALEGLPGVTRVEVDLEHDLFRISGFAGEPDAALKAVRDLGYLPRVSDTAAFHIHAPPLHPTGTPAELIRNAIARAKASSKRFVLVDCMGDNWIACTQMSAKTFADPAVKRLIEKHFEFVALNVDHEREAAGWFASASIPDTWVLDLDGRILDRVVGFMEPKAFAARLERLVLDRK